MSVSLVGAGGYWGVDLPRSAVWLKQNCGVRFGASGVLDMTGLAGLGGVDIVGEGGETGGCESLLFQSMPARLICWLLRDVGSMNV